MKLLKLFLLLPLLLFTPNKAVSQTQYKSVTVGFYNVENLFDPYYSVDVVNKNYPFADPRYKVSMPLDSAQLYVEKYESINGKDSMVYIDKQILNDEFTPIGNKNFTQKKYERKLFNLAEIISNLGKTVTNTAPAIVGLAEVENLQVVQDLVNQEALAKYNYGVVHFNSFDSRGIDVALIYQKSRFQPTKTKRYIVELPKNEDGYKEKTRDILRVSGKLDGENFTFLVNHWPSRRGGEKASEPKRQAAAKVLRSIYEEMWNKNEDEKIIAMGDFNDDPVNSSIKEVLKASKKSTNLGAKDIYSPMEKLYKEGQGTLAYRDSWNLFDMMFFSSNLVGSKDYSSYKLFKTMIYTNASIIAKTGQWKGYPRRGFSGDTFDPDGYSDHFPVYSILIREK